MSDHAWSHSTVIVTIIVFSPSAMFYHCVSDKAAKSFKIDSTLGSLGLSLEDTILQGFHTLDPFPLGTSWSSSFPRAFTVSYFCKCEFKILSVTERFHWSISCYVYACSVHRAPFVCRGTKLGRSTEREPLTFRSLHSSLQLVWFRAPPTCCLYFYLL